MTTSIKKGERSQGMRPFQGGRGLERNGALGGDVGRGLGVPAEAGVPALVEDARIGGKGTAADALCAEPRQRASCHYGGCCW